MIGELGVVPSTRRSALDNRAFRSLLLVVSGIPIAVLYLWRGVVQPLVFGGYLGDFQESYMRAAGRIAAGLDPYDLCATAGCLEPTGPQYVMPPVLAWMLQPLVRVDPLWIEFGAITLMNVSLAVFLWFTLKTLRVSDWQLAALLVLAALSFEPVLGNIEEGQVNLVLLALSGVWLWAWVVGRSWGGVALGAAVALKLIQGPVVLLVLWGRRWGMFAAAAAAGLVTWLAGAPQYLLEYLFKVLPPVSQGTGFFENHSPGGTITRLFEPATFLGPLRGSPPGARVLTVMVAIAAIAVTVVVLRSPGRAPARRTLEAGAAVAVTPLVATYSWGTHLVLLLVPILVLVTWGIRRRDWLVIGLVAAGWLLISPAHKLLQALLVSGYSDPLVLRVMAEFGVAGILCIWVASLVALRRNGSADGLDPAHEPRARE